MDKKFDARFDSVDKKFDGLDKKFATKEDLQAALHSQTKWLIVSIMAIVTCAIGAVKFFWDITPHSKGAWRLFSSVS